MKAPSFHALAATLFALLACPAFGQRSTAPAFPTPAELQTTDDETVFLDPFVVSAAEDRDSYEATATTAATRIRTELKDVGSAISVITTQFLKDTGTRNSQDLLVYTTNTEVGGPRGNFAGLGDLLRLSDLNVRLAPLSNTRIRGLTAADNTRDFFLTDVAWDSFNVGRIDIQRGPNAILFGLGSPAGIINASTNSASFANGGAVEFRWGRFGSHRATLDLNLVLRRDELAVRVDALDDRTNYQQKPAFNHDRRISGALRWDPKFLGRGSAHTSLKINFEHGDIKANRPHILPPTDLITPWFDLLNRRGSDPAAPNGSEVIPLKQILGRKILAIFDDPASGAGILGPVDGPGTITLAVLKNPVDYIPKPSSPAEMFKVYRPSVLQDPSIFDYIHLLLEGPNKSETSGHDITNVTLAQTFGDGRLGVEAAYDHQDATRSTLGDSQNLPVTVDINTRRLDGSPNPNFGRAMTIGTGVGNSAFVSSREAARVTGFAELRFTDFLRGSALTRALGRHVFTGFGSREKADIENYGWASQSADGSFAPYLGAGGNQLSNRRLGQINYLSPSLVDRTTAVGAHVGNVQVVQRANSGTINFYNAAAPGWVDLPLAVTSNFDGARTMADFANLSRDVVESRGLVWQGFLFDELVVPMIGLRHDRDRAYALNPIPRNADGSVNFASPSYQQPSIPNNIVSGNSTSWSLVVHAPSFVREKLPAGIGVDLFYNRSENFQPKAGRIDVIGNLLPPPVGQTKDYGFRLTLPDGRFSMKVSWYDTTVTNDSLPRFDLSPIFNAEAWGYMFARQTLANNGAGVGSFTGGYAPLAGQTAEEAKADGIAITTAFLAPAHQPPDSFFALYGIDRSGWPGFISGNFPPGLTITGDTRSKGIEYEIAAQPTAHWNLSLNASKTNAQSHNLAASAAAWIEQRWAVFNTSVVGTSRAAVVGDVRMWDPRYDSNNTILSMYRRGVWIPYLIHKLKDGANVNELRPWRFNLVSDYTFSQGRLKGLNVGGAYRWQDKEIVGYPVFANAGADASAAYDLAHPYTGPAETNIDLWIGYQREFAEKYTWRVQLNVNNALAGDDLIPVTVQPDGRMAAGRIPAPTTWTVTNSISF